MPFGNASVDRSHFEKMESLYSDWIKPTVESIKIPGREDGNLRCHRADQDLSSGDIMDHVAEHLIASDIVIADLTGRNANVFYELGVRHAVNNATILIAEGTEHIPFDLHTLRAIIYEYTPKGMLRLQRDLKGANSAILEAPEKIDNSIRRVLYQRETAKLVSQQVPPGFDVVRGLMTEIVNLKNEISNQRADISSLFGAITKKPSGEPLHRLEGVWRDDMSDSVFCIKVIGEELRGVYSYGQPDQVTSRLYECRSVGDLVVCRFEWMSGEIRGFVALELTDPNTLKGGWCYESDLKKTSKTRTKSLFGQMDVSEVLDTFGGDLSSFYKLVLVRDEKSHYPRWAESYFRHIRLND
jgi:hypothetical protein